MAASATRACACACAVALSCAGLATGVVRAGEERTTAPCPPAAPVVAERNAPAVPELPGFVPTPCNPAALRPPSPADVGKFAGLPDRWRIASTLGYPERLRDPYHGNNWLKGDRPAFGADWFVNLAAVADTSVEPRRFPLPVGNVVTQRPGSLDAYGHGASRVYAQTLALEAVLYKGDTVFKPPEWEFRLTPVFSVNRVELGERGLVNAAADAPLSRTDTALGLQAAFVDRHLRNVSAHYDFDSLRVGIQPVTADFRGFLYTDAALGVRLFGTRANNRYQYNLGWFRRLEKDTNSGLNAVFARGPASLRKDNVVLANLYAQDTPLPGFTSQLVIAYNRNREGAEVAYDGNGVLQRPAQIGAGRGRDYEVTYLGVNGDGHVGALNATLAGYFVFGHESRGTFVAAADQVRAFFAAAEVSRDWDWLRIRASFALQSADHDPFDRRATGFDAIVENPLFAGADTSFWIRQPVPLIAGGGVSLSGRNGLLSSLRSSKEFGQSNFTNPGLQLVGVGADADLTPTLRVSANANDLRFGDTAVLEVARAQKSIPGRIGLDLSFALSWRPLATQNVVARLSAAKLLPGSGWKALYGGEQGYSILGNLILSY